MRGRFVHVNSLIVSHQDPIVGWGCGGGSTCPQIPCRARVQPGCPSQTLQVGWALALPRRGGCMTSQVKMREYGDEDM